MGPMGDIILGGGGWSKSSGEGERAWGQVGTRGEGGGGGGGEKEEESSITEKNYYSLGCLKSE